MHPTVDIWAFRYGQAIGVQFVSPRAEQWRANNHRFSDVEPGSTVYMDPSDYVAMCVELDGTGLLVFEDSGEAH